MVEQLTFAELRHMLGFGVVRLKLLLVLREHPELDGDDWDGQLVFTVTREHRGRVFAEIREGKREVTLPSVDGV